MEKNLPNIAKCLAAFIFAYCCCGNLICNGDFEAYDLTINPYIGNSSYFDSDTACWYTKSSTAFQVNLVWDSPLSEATQVLDLLFWS